MFEILMFLFESYFDAGSYPQPDKLSFKLSAAGFEEEEIDEVLTWLTELQQQNPDNYPDTLNCTGQRIFSEHELTYLSDEARHFLMFAEHQQLITGVEREMILDRAVALQRENLALDKFKLVMLMVLWNRQQHIDPLLVEELLAPLSQGRLH
jgi:Smg protein